MLNTSSIEHNSVNCTSENMTRINIHNIQKLDGYFKKYTSKFQEEKISKGLNTKIFSSGGDVIRWKFSHIAGRKVNWNSILLKQFGKCELFQYWTSNSSYPINLSKEVIRNVDKVFCAKMLTNVVLMLVNWK